MNIQDSIYFEALTRDRAENADTLEKPSMSGIKKSVVEKYSDQAHFIYELLQNADDVSATSVRFVLEKDKLIFVHNGTRHFSVTDPAHEGEDSAFGRLGDINAITSIANSNKTQASIGKFGVGFKAVFQYTSVPYIYDPEFRFKIERFIVPVVLQNDYPSRNPEETLFVFPFDDRLERNSQKAYSDISTKLCSLKFPLLFLSNLRNITFEFGNTSGEYNKVIRKSITHNKTQIDLIRLIKTVGDEQQQDNLFLFTRKDNDNRSYSVGFFLNPDGHLKPVNEPAFCFFPTKEVTNLHYIIHAPFLLTDSREGIRAGVDHNEKMIDKLASLSADALEMLKLMGETLNVRLIDDNIFRIIPYNEKQFNEVSDKTKLSFKPFFNEIKWAMKRRTLIPSTTGYVRSENAYWAADMHSQLTKILSNEQLAKLVENNYAGWAFPSIGREETQSSNQALFEYISDITRTYVTEESVIIGRKREYSYNKRLGQRVEVEKIKGLDEDFIAGQSIDWLHLFYKWLGSNKVRLKLAIKKTIFIDQYGKAAPVFDKDGQFVLFLPVKDMTGYRFVNSKLLENEDTAEFIKDIGIQEPSLKDRIYNVILPMYREENTEIDIDSHFIIFFEYYCECNVEESNSFIQLIKNCDFLCFSEKENLYRGKASELYLPTEELKKYFESKPLTKFVVYDDYIKMVGNEREKKLVLFLKNLGVADEPRIESVETDIEHRIELSFPHSTRGYVWSENQLDGCIELVDSISNSKDIEKSVFLWNLIIKLLEEKNTGWAKLSIKSLLRGSCKYFFRHAREEYYDSQCFTKLKTSRWLVNKAGSFVSPSEINIAELADIYEIDSDIATGLIEDLGISTDIIADEKDNLSEEQRQQIDFAKQIEEFGISKEEALEIIAEYKRKKEAKNTIISAQSFDKTVKMDNDQPDDNEDTSLTDDNAIKELDMSEEDLDYVANAKNSDKIERHKKIQTEIVKDIYKRTREKRVVPKDEDEEIDSDEWKPSTVDYSKRIERAKVKSATEIDKIAHLEELQEKALKSTVYSYEWFKTLLEMECLNSNESNQNNREISISFSKVEREPGTNRTLVLMHPNRYIPQFMEDLADIPMILHMGDNTKTLAIEVANIRSYTLRVKLKSDVDISGIDLTKVDAVSIEAKSPVFLLEELRKQFDDLGYKSDFDMKKNLCENIDFIFGPPGTGKTTYLAKNVLIPLMGKNVNCRVLVLTPTNKSADVLVHRIMELHGFSRNYENWLVRFGATGEEFIEQSPVFREKSFDIRSMEKNVTVTTIARFPYDFFMPEDKRLYLQALNWDYIVIDEASMIPLINIIYPLYKKTPKKFIIAGDPFQIGPITSLSFWKDMNIYTLVGLESFTDPKTEPYQYDVKLLTTQYRSIPEIGNIFSRFAYGGILSHYRKKADQRIIRLDADEIMDTLNILKYPVSKYESIYRAKKLQQSSSYQIYSALFVFEYICNLSKIITYNNPGEEYKIGIIAPYRAQADLIEKLIASERFPKSFDVQVGTIHGFQGDECDIIFAVFNTPPHISSSTEMFLNKRNIINVSISRARDYLFVVMPDDDTDNIENLRLVKRVESLIKSSDKWNEKLTPDIENNMFGNSQYIMNNAFSTGHHSVNVYGLPEKCYEVRTEDNAVDIQIHKGIK